MGAALEFVFRSSIVMLAMYLVYKTMLSGEKRHGFSRGILISVYVLSPLVVWLADAVSRGGDVAGAAGQLDDSEMLELLMANAAGGPVAVNMAPGWSVVVLWVWLAGIAVAVGAMLWSWLMVRRIISRCDIERREGYTLVLSPDSDIAPFSMRRTVVMSRKDYEESGEMILVHELRHLACRHWIDLAVARVVAVVAWFNPASWLMAEELRMVHEYQADAAVIRSGADARAYQMLLIKKTVGRSFPAIANSLNHSNLKKRITMMIKSKSAKGRRWRSLAMVPAVVAVLALTNLPGVASVLTEMGNASLSDGKGTQNSVEREIKRVPMDSIRNLELKKDGEKEEDRTLAQFKGGELEMYAWLAKHLRMPKVKNAPEKALVVVQFDIDETGKVGNAEILRGSIDEYNAEALRVVGEMPDFIPATENGKPIASRYALPVHFNLK